MDENEEFEFRMRHEAELAAKKPAKVAAVADLPQKSILQAAGQHVGNLAAGAVRGAGSIGATILYPWDKAQDLYYGDRGKNIESLISGKEKPSRNEERRQQMDAGLGTMGAETDSNMYGVGKIAGEIAGTAGAGGVIGNGVLRAAPVLVRLGASAPAINATAKALASGGFKAGGLTGLKGLVARGAAGAITGGASAGMVDPANAGVGSAIGAALPGVAKVGGALGGMAANGAKAGSRRLMQSAIKPTIAQLRSGDAATAIDVMLKHGINPSAGGVAKLRDLIGGIDDQISDKIANSTAMVNKFNVISAVKDVRNQFRNQVSPTADLNAINSTVEDFAQHPSIQGDLIPVQLAQKMKQGTYKVLAKKYGQIGSAETEAQKGLARGLKEEIATAVPGVGALNAEESRMITTLGVAERRALMELNKNPVGLAGLAHSPVSWAMFMADKSAAFKSLAARMVHSSANAAQAAGPRIQGIASLPMIRATAAAVPSRRE